MLSLSLSLSDLLGSAHLLAWSAQQSEALHQPSNLTPFQSESAGAEFIQKAHKGTHTRDAPLPISYYLARISIGNGTKNAAIYCAIGSQCIHILFYVYAHERRPTRSAHTTRKRTAAIFHQAPDPLKSQSNWLRLYASLIRLPVGACRSC